MKREEQTILVAHRNIGIAGGGIPVGASVVPELKGPRAVEALDLWQDISLHGASENTDVERGAVLQSLAGKLIVHRHSEGTGGELVRDLDKELEGGRALFALRGDPATTFRQLRLIYASL